MLRSFFDFMAKLGLSVRDDPPKVVNLTIRKWGETQAGLALSAMEIPREDQAALPRISIVIRNADGEGKSFQVPGWLFFYRVEVRLPNGSRAPMSPFGLAIMKPERQAERLEISLAPGEFRETEIPIGSLFNLHSRGRYVVAVTCEPFGGVTLTSNEIALG